MAACHDIENLTRRGNIFYWHARVPSAFGKCQPGSRLSLSLHCSDHKKAQAIGRKLNMLVAELKLQQKRPMSKGGFKSFANTNMTRASESAQSDHSIRWRPMLTTTRNALSGNV